MRLLQQLVNERATITASQTEILERAADNESDLTDTDVANLDGLAERAAELDARIEQLRDIESRNAAAATVRADLSEGTTTEDRQPTGAAVVRSEPTTYREGGPHSFFTDLFQAQINRNPVALDRITQHTREMVVDGVVTRDAGVAAAANLVVPQYLTSMAAQFLRAGRPFADICTRYPLPDDGMTINVHRTTTGVSAAIQASENASVSETDFADTVLTVNVRTIAGQIDMSRQLVERGTGIEQLVMADLANAYNTALDSGIINDDGTSGTHLGVINTSGIISRDTDDATPTAAEVWAQIVKGLGDVATQRYAPANIIVMHPRRWSFLMSALDGSSRPLFGYTETTARNPAGIGTADYGAVGTIHGVPVVTDANIPTDYGAGTEDVVIIARREDLILWEDPGAPLMVRFEEGQAAANNSASLTVKLVAYGYSAFTAGRYPTGICLYEGTSLIAPS